MKGKTRQPIPVSRDQVPSATDVVDARWRSGSNLA